KPVIPGYQWNSPPRAAIERLRTPLTQTGLTFKNLTMDQVYERLSPLGVQPRLARLLQVTAVRQGQYPDLVPGVSARVLDQVRQRSIIPNLTLVDKVVSFQDGFAKYLFRGERPEAIEAVRIPLLHRPENPKYVVCVSAQVGCAMACEFCATGRLGFHGNLAAWEIVDQVVKIQADSPHPVRGVVFMGMGEPMLNYANVMQAATILSESCGMAIAGKAITISTVGIVPGIRLYTAQRRRFRLVVSLVSANPEVRRSLMPIENSHPTSQLIEALREYHEATHRRVTLAWIMISGVNTRDEDAAQLAELTRGLPVKLDLIDVNDPTGRFRPPSPEELHRFRDALTAQLGVPVDRRYSGGKDIHAACGMLAGRALEGQISQLSTPHLQDI
ncbi:MAG: radical SAM protein, partial [Thermoguttaceae bacterium]